MTIRTRGLREIEEGFRRAFGSAFVRAQVVTKSTHGTLKFGKAFTKSEQRTEVQNLIILRTQAKAGRDVVHFAQSVQRQGNAIWRGAIGAYLKGVGDLKAGATKVAELMRASLVQNIETGRGASGMKPLSPWYERIKESSYGKKPILEKTGQLKKSLQIAIKAGGKHGRLFRS